MFIDRNGKIFGKINIIDFIFVLLLSFLAFVFYPKLRQLYVLELVPLYYKDKSKMSLIKDGSFNHVGQETKKISIPVIPKKLEEKNLVIKVNFGGNHKEVARVIKAGDWDEQEPTTRILKILYVNPVIRTDLKGKIFQDPNFQDVTLELLVHGYIDGEKFFYKGKQLRFGSDFLFHTIKYDIEGRVVDIGENTSEDYMFLEENQKIKVKDVPVTSKMESKGLILKISFRGYDKDIADFIRRGDKDERDPTTQVLRVLRVSPLLQVVPEGRWFFDAKLKEIVLELFISAYTDGERFFYRGKPIKLGNYLLLYTAKYDMNGQIIGISEKIPNKYKIFLNENKKIL